MCWINIVIGALCFVTCSVNGAGILYFTICKTIKDFKKEEINQHYLFILKRTWLNEAMRDLDLTSIQMPAFYFDALRDVLQANDCQLSCVTHFCAKVLENCTFNAKLLSWLFVSKITCC